MAVGGRASGQRSEKKRSFACRTKKYYLLISCAGYLGHPFRKRHLESDLLVPCCLQESSGKGRIREHACISSVGPLLSLRKGEACVPRSHPSQATNTSLLSRAL